MFGLNKEVFYPHSPEKVWLLLTNSRALAAWLMENDFEPRVGCKFCFYSQSLPGIDTNKWVCKIICVIASDSEAISKCCDCVVSLRSTRNDKCTINFT